MEDALARAIQAVPNGAHAASEIWKRLDQLAENDPAAYKNFIEEQLKEAGNCDASSSRSKPSAILSAARLQPHQGSAPCTIIISIFACGSGQPNAAGLVALHSKAKPETLDIKFQDRRAAFNVGGGNEQRRVFELNAHPDAVQFMCKNCPPDFREAVVEQACLHVEALAGIRLCRHKRTLKVLTELASKQEVAQAASAAKAKAVERAADGTSVEGCPGLVAQLQTIVSEPVSHPKHAGKHDSVHKPLIQELGGQSPTCTADNHQQQPLETLKPALKVELRRTACTAKVFVQLPLYCAIEDVTVASSDGNMYVSVPGHQTTTICTTSLGIHSETVEYSKRYHSLRFLCPEMVALGTK